MAILEIKKYPDPILRKKCGEVKEIAPNIKQLINDMIETMEENKGVGLAAPQVGVLKRIIVARTDYGPKAFINPEIIKKTKEKEIMEEGCLSFPDLWLKVERAKGVEMFSFAEDFSAKGGQITALDTNGNKMKAVGFLARILQHEIDHLDGILFIDRISFWQRLKIRKKLKEIEEKYGSR